MNFPRYDVKIIGGKLRKIPIRDIGGFENQQGAPPTCSSSRNAYTWPRRNPRNKNWSRNSTLPPLQEKKTLDVLSDRKSTQELALRVSNALAGVHPRTIKKLLSEFARLDYDHSGRITKTELEEVFRSLRVFILGNTMEELVKMFDVGRGEIYFKPLHMFLEECYAMKENHSLPYGVVGLGLDRVNLLQESTAFKDREEAHLIFKLEKEMKQHNSKFQLDDLRSLLKASDVLNTGVFGREMIRICCNHVKLPLPPEVLEHLLNHCDTNKDGQIDWIEFMRYLERAQPVNMGRITSTSASSVGLWESKEPLPDVTKNTKKNNRQNIPDIIQDRPRMVSGQTQTESGPQPEVINVQGHKVQVYAPDEFINIHPCPDPPSVSPVLEWVYGYRGKDCRNNLFVLASDELVYFIAGVVVIYDPDSHKQRHYIEHSDDIRSLAVHPNRVIVASGQAASRKGGNGRAQIRIWDSSTLKTICAFGSGFFEKAVVALDFSRKDGYDKGNYLVAVDDSHIISLWDWKKKKKLSSVRGHMDQILGIIFSPYENEFLSYGKQHFSFWFVDDDKKMRSTRGRFEQKNRPSFVTCVAFTANGDVVTGDSNGSLIVWPENKNIFSNTITNAHEGPIFALFLLSNGVMLSAGGTDGIIRAWDRRMQPLGVDLKLPDHVIGVRSLAVGIGDVLYIGTTNHTLLEAKLHTGASPLINSALHVKPLVQGHYESVYAVTCHPKLKQFLTGSSDLNVQLWDAENFKMLWSTDLKCSLQSLCFHPEDNVAVAGCKDGSWNLLDVTTGESLRKMKSGQEKINAVQFSPAGLHLAVASEDKNIYVYRYQTDRKTLEYVGRLQGHTSGVKNLDWADEGEKLQSASDYELLYGDALKCETIKSSEMMRDTKWKTFTCKLGYPVIGVQGHKLDGTSVSCVTASENKQLIATGNESGKVKLFVYPCNHTDAESTESTVHSGNVLGVSWLYGDNKLVSVGGKDTSIMQWKIEKDE